MESNTEIIKEFWRKVKFQAFQTYSDWRGLLTGTDATGVRYDSPIRKLQRGEMTPREYWEG